MWPRTGARWPGTTTGSAGWRCLADARRPATASSSVSTRADSAPTWPAAPRSPATTWRWRPVEPGELVARPRLVGAARPAVGHRSPGSHRGAADRETRPRHAQLRRGADDVRAAVPGRRLRAPRRADRREGHEDLALHDALLLADALVAYYLRGDSDRTARLLCTVCGGCGSTRNSARWFAELLHGPSSGDPFRAGSAQARLRRILGSPAAAATSPSRTSARSPARWP